MSVEIVIPQSVDIREVSKDVPSILSNSEVNADGLVLEKSRRKEHAYKIRGSLNDEIFTGGAARNLGGVRNRLLTLNFHVLREIVQQVSLIGSIINTRCDQIYPYCVPAESKSSKGYVIKKKVRYIAGVNDIHAELTNDELDEIEEIYRFFEGTGFRGSRAREDSFEDYINMIIRDILTIDQIATELQFNRRGEVVAFWALDGASIKRVADVDNSSQVSGFDYIQEVEDKVVAKFMSDQLVFDYKNKRSDVRFRGYGLSPVEQAVDTITTLLFANKYSRDQFIRDKVPKGFLSISGDVTDETIEAMQRHWYHAMAGSGGRWNIPILPGGDNGVDFKMIGGSNRDMEFEKLNMLIISMVCAVFSIDPAEMALKTSSHTPLQGEDVVMKLQASKDRGLRSLLQFIESYCNKILSRVSDKYVFKFVGDDVENEELQNKINLSALGVHSTVNEIRAMVGKKKLDEPYADVVLNPQAVQIHLANKAQEQQEKQQQQEREDSDDEYEDDDGDDTDNEDENDEEDDDGLSKSIKESLSFLSY